MHLIYIGIGWFYTVVAAQEDRGIEMWTIWCRGAVLSNLVPGDKAQHSDQVCVCGVTIGGYMMCDYAAQKTLINAMTMT